MAGQREEVVVDSSVAVKWFSREAETDRALRLRDQHVKGGRRLWVSDLLYHEVANALRYKPSFDHSKLQQAIDSLFGLHLNTWPVDERLLREATVKAYQGKVTVYDAVPVALAETMSALCVTADERTQFRRLKALGSPIVLLSKIQL